MNAAALDLIRKYEGLRLQAYLDAAGVWTIGYGHTENVKPGQVITKDHAEQLLEHDAQLAWDTVTDLVTVPLNDNQHAALTSFVYNVGRDAFRRSTLLKKLNSGDYAAVPSELMRWDKVKGQQVPGLTRRRIDEAHLWSQAIEPVSVTPTEPDRRPLYKTKTIIGGVTAFFGGIVNNLTGDDLTNVADKISAFSDLGQFVKGLALFLTVAGFLLVIYGRLKVRQNTGA
jgi:lysozyme